MRSVDIAAAPSFGLSTTIYARPRAEAVGPQPAQVAHLAAAPAAPGAGGEPDTTDAKADDDPPKEKAPMRETSAPLSKPAQQKQNRKKYSAKSCAIEAQHDRIIEALRRRPHTTQDLRMLIGIFQVSTRIKELRELGWNIETHRVNIVDSWGFFHPRCAMYSLAEAAQ